MLILRLFRINVHFFMLHRELYFHCRLKRNTEGVKTLEEESLDKKNPNQTKKLFLKIVDSKKYPADVIFLFSFYITSRILIVSK